MDIKRVWAMPTKDTFDCKPIGELVKRYLQNSELSIDPFAGNKRWATITNDLNPALNAIYKLEALDFLKHIRVKNVEPDLVLFDPPYSPRQIKELYNSIGIDTYLEMAHKTAGWKKEKDIINQILKPGGIVITCDWNSMGMGKKRGYEIIEILLVCHGAGHNDTIVVVDRKLQHNFT